LVPAQEPRACRRSTQDSAPDSAEEPIGRLRTRVLATNTSTGKTDAELVSAVLVHYDTNRYNLKVRTADGAAVIHTTTAHLFWDPYQHQWIASSKLAKGERLQTANGSPATVVAGSVPAAHDRWMWDLTVPGNNDHDFYVVTGDTPVLVHNSGPFCGTPTGGKAGDELGDEEFHGSGYNLNEITQFVGGHTDAENPAMGRPSFQQIENVLRQAGPEQVGDQNAAQFVKNGIRVIVNYDMPWRSTAYFIGR
jgi:Pretoxin HINT domain